MCMLYGYPAFYAVNLRNNPEGENTNVWELDRKRRTVLAGLTLHGSHQGFIKPELIKRASRDLSLWTFCLQRLHNVFCCGCFASGDSGQISQEENQISEEEDRSHSVGPDPQGRVRVHRARWHLPSSPEESSKGWRIRRGEEQSQSSPLHQTPGGHQSIGPDQGHRGIRFLQAEQEAPYTSEEEGGEKEEARCEKG